MRWLELTLLDRFIEIPDEKFRGPALVLLAILIVLWVLL